MRYIAIILFFWAVLSPAELTGSETKQVSSSKGIPVAADTILDKVMERAVHYSTLVSGYHADLYVKGKVHIRKKNQLIRFMPSMFRPKKNVKDYLIESYSDLHYTAPNIYDQKVKLVNGTVNKHGGIGGDVLDYFNVNIYSSSLLHTKLLSPLSLIAKQYYLYHLDSVIVNGDQKSYRILFEPRYKSYQLVEGHMIISGGVWSVREMQFSGQSEYLHFNDLIRMGEPGTDSEYLPLHCDLSATFRLLGNTVDCNYMADLNYRSVEFDDEDMFVFSRKKKYDLTEAYKLHCDTAKYSKDIARFNHVRPIPLSIQEQEIYEKFYLRNDTVSVRSKKKHERHEFWGTVGDMLVSNYTVNLASVGSVKCSPLINPFLMSYGSRNGFSYRQEFKYNRLFTGDRLLRIVPKIGYNFTHGEFYWQLKADYDYWPQKRSAFHLRMGNGNRIYNSKVLDELKQIPDSVFDFKKVHLDYFRDFYVDLRHSFEITNGLIWEVGILTHTRTAVKKSDLTIVKPPEDEDEKEEITEKFRNKYVSFAPRMRLSWTPGQYYYMNGKRKVNLHADYPTFSVDWERGIKGVFSATGEYERIEFDMQHRLQLGLMRSFYYRIGMGAFTNQEQLYFVDFVNFAKNNLPAGWNDDIGGTFQLLDRRWYNSSRKYLRSNITYETPFFFLPRWLLHTRNILNERLYAGVLMMPHLNPYIEIGYGIGTHIFDFGVFAGNTNGKFTDFGVKFTFELFNR